MSSKREGSPWSLKLNTASLVLIPAAIGINYVGKLFASMLKLPLWLDSIGTCLSACMAGPVVGALSGFLTNVIYGLTMDPISTVYGLTQAGIGIAVGLMAWYGHMRKAPGILVAGLVAGLVDADVHHIIRSEAFVRGVGTLQHAQRLANGRQAQRGSEGFDLSSDRIVGTVLIDHGTGTACTIESTT